MPDPGFAEAESVKRQVGSIVRDPMLNLHCLLPGTRANGPGERVGLWFQGCSRGCAGCINREMQEHAPRIRKPVSAVVMEILEAGAANPGIEGVSISGGEPLEQAEGLLALLTGLRAASGLSVLVFSGFRLEEIRRMRLGREILAKIDVLIDGPYEADNHLGRGLRGSSNQRIHCLTDRYTEAEVEATPEAEIRIGPDGTIQVSGVDPVSAFA